MNVCGGLKGGIPQNKHTALAAYAWRSCGIIKPVHGL